jgi:hypothetical protein
MDFPVYITFWAISTFSITSLEQEVTLNMDVADDGIQIAFHYVDITMNVMTTLSIIQQCLEVLLFLLLKFPSNRQHFVNTRPLVVEIQVAILAFLNIVIQVIHVIKKCSIYPDDLKQLFGSEFIPLVPLLLLVGVCNLYAIGLTIQVFIASSKVTTTSTTV